MAVRAIGPAITAAPTGTGREAMAVADTTTITQVTATDTRSPATSSKLPKRQRP